MRSLLISLAFLAACGSPRPRPAPPPPPPPPPSNEPVTIQMGDGERRERAVDPRREREDAKAEGRRAAGRGDAIDSCPYAERGLADAWRSGWQEVQSALASDAASRGGGGGGRGQPAPSPAPRSPGTAPSPTSSYSSSSSSSGDEDRQRAREDEFWSALRAIERQRRNEADQAEYTRNNARWRTRSDDRDALQTIEVTYNDELEQIDARTDASVADLVRQYRDVRRLDRDGNGNVDPVFELGYTRDDGTYVLGRFLYR